MIFFTSDQHFFHHNIIKYEHRPFSDVYEMNRALIDAFNKKVSNADSTYHLGDFAFMNNANAVYEKLFKNLNGTHHFIKGNHDKWTRQFNKPDYKNVIVYNDSILELNINKVKLVLCHYPLYSWNASFHGSIHLYGHVHSNMSEELKNRKNCFNVGVDVRNFEPVTLEEIIV